MAKFKVGDKVRVVKTIYSSVYNGYNVGDIFEVEEVFSESLNTVGGPRLWFKEVEKVSDKPTKNQRISDLEREVASLQRNLIDAAKQIEMLVERVEALEGASLGVKYVPVTTDNIEVGDVIRVINAEGVECASLTNDECYKVTNVYFDGDFDVIDDDGDYVMITTDEFQYVVKAVI